MDGKTETMDAAAIIMASPLFNLSFNFFNLLTSILFFDLYQNPAPAGFPACGGLRQQHNSAPPQCNPPEGFRAGNAVSCTKKIPAMCRVGKLLVLLCQPEKG